MSAKEVERKTWDAVAKREVANQILDGKVLVEEVRRRYSLQAYQLYAWIGQAAVARLNKAHQLPAAPPRRHEKPEAPTAKLTELEGLSDLLELARALKAGRARSAR